MEKEEFIKIVKEQGFEVALSISAREDNKGWLCPMCKSPVIITSQERYETSGEHVTDPNVEVRPERDAYRCTNDDCICNDEKHDVFWSYNGEMYGGFMIDDEDFIGENNAPFGSFERKINVEIGKCGLEDKKYLHPVWCLWLLQPYIEYHYKADVLGNVLKKSFTIEFLKKDDKGDYCYGWTPAWRTWKFKWRIFKANLLSYKEHGNIEMLEEAFEIKPFNSWDSKLFTNVMRVLYYKYYKKVKK